MSQTSRRDLFRGWPLVGWTALFVGSVVLLVFAVDGTAEGGSRHAIRVTALTSGILFSLAFAASPLVKLWPNAATRWIAANRRYLGVSFATSHAFHMLAILNLVHVVGSAEDAKISVLTRIAGGFGYVVIAAMVATSFDRTAAMIGRRAWTRLHNFGLYFLWFIFAQNYGMSFARSPVHFALALLFFGVAALRLIAWFGARRGAS